MSRGRKKKPTALKKLQGNPGHRPLGTEPEPSKPDKPPRAPSHLSPIAKKEWSKVARTLWETGLLTDADTHALELCLEAYATWRELRALVQEQGYLIETHKGTTMKNPAHQAAEGAWRTYLSYAREFGLTPSARASLSGGVADEDRLSLAEAMERELAFFERTQDDS